MLAISTSRGDDMPKITSTLGTGMTQRGVVEYDWEQPGDADAQVRAAIETFDRSSFARLSRRLAEIVTPVLDQVGLPSDPEGEYLVTPDGEWAPVTEEVGLGPEFEDARLSLEVAVMLCGYPHDSPQGYAARVLMTLREARQQLQAGSLDEAMAYAFGAGELVKEAAMKGAFELDFLAGEKVRAGGRKGHEQTYGTLEEKAARRAGYLEAFDQEIAKGAGKMKAYEVAAKKCGVTPKTIQRAVDKRKRQG